MASVYVLYLGGISWTKATAPLAKQTCNNAIATCNVYGWQNFLLVNDIFGGECLEHSKFLSMDLHFYLITILICLCYRRFDMKKYSKIIAVSIAVIAWIVMATDVLLFKKKYGTETVDKQKMVNMMTDPCYSMPLDPNNETCIEAQKFMEKSPFGPMGFGFLVPEFKNHFFLPWSHLITYCVGIFFGILLQEMSIESVEQYKLSKFQLLTGWSIAIVGLAFGFCFPANKILAYPWLLCRNFGIAGFLGWLCYLLFQFKCFGEDSSQKVLRKSVVLLGGVSGKSWSGIFMWAVLLGPVIMEFYYGLWLEETIYIQDSVTLVMWLGFCCLTFASSYVLKIILF